MASALRSDTPKNKSLEIEGFGKSWDLISYNPDFKAVGFDGFSLNALAIRQMRTLTSMNSQQLDGGEP